MSFVAKGAKFIYAWSVIGSDGSFYLPEKALEEYHISPGTPIILMSGRNTSKGFSVVCKELIGNSPLATVFASLPQLMNFSIEEGSVIKFKERLFCWVNLSEDSVFRLPLRSLKLFGLEPGDKLLCLRTCHLSFSCLGEGPYVERAESSGDYKVYKAAPSN